MATAAERQAKLRAKRKAEGLVPVTVYVPAQQVAAVMLLAERLCADRDTEVGPVRNVRTGRLGKL